MWRMQLACGTIVGSLALFAGVAYGTPQDTLVALRINDAGHGRSALAHRRSASVALAHHLGLGRGEILPTTGVVHITLGDGERARLARHPEVRTVAVRAGDAHTPAAEPVHVGFHSGNWGLAAIAAPEAWNEWGVTGRGVRIGVIDSGIRPEHADLGGRIARWRDFADNEDQPGDSGLHGSHVAGTIAGGAHSGLPIGVAPDATLVIARVQGKNSDGVDPLSALRAMEWMSDPDGDPQTADWPRIVNCSWGGDDPTDAMFDEVLALWQRMGIAPVFAAGNSGPDPNTMGAPAARPGAIAVGATDARGALTDFTSRGNGDIRLRAPGVEVVSSVGSESHLAFDGTSMAAPHVAGALALLAEARPDLPSSALVQALADSQGAGPINVSRALAALDVPRRTIGPTIVAVAGPGRWTNGVGTLPFALARPAHWRAQGRIDDGPWSAPTDGFIMLDAPSAEGQYTVSLRALAPDGTTHDADPISLGIDRTAPRATFTVTRLRGIGHVRLAVDTADAASGVSADQTTFIINGKAPIGGQAMQIDLLYGGWADRVHLAASVMDRAGNESIAGRRWTFTPRGALRRAWNLRTARTLIGMMGMTLQNIANGNDLQLARRSTGQCLPDARTLARKLRRDYRFPVRILSPQSKAPVRAVALWSTPRTAVIRLRVPGAKVLTTRITADACRA